MFTLSWGKASGKKQHKLHRLKIFFDVDSTALENQWKCWPHVKHSVSVLKVFRLHNAVPSSFITYQNNNCIVCHFSLSLNLFVENVNEAHLFPPTAQYSQINSIFAVHRSLTSDNVYQSTVYIQNVHIKQCSSHSMLICSIVKLTSSSKSYPPPWHNSRK